jgi:hypothetical protein
VQLHPRDTVDYAGAAWAITGVVVYRLAERTLRLARLRGPETLFVDLPGNPASARLLVLAELPALDLTTPPPAAIYHGGESYLPQLGGTADITLTGEVPEVCGPLCTLWRYRAAGDRYLQIEAWPTGVRMLAGATVHESMIEVRPARL